MSRDVRIVLRQKDGLRDHARIRQDQRTGDMIVTVRAGLLSTEAWYTMQQVLDVLSDDYYPGLPEPVRRKKAAETRRQIDREEAERLAKMEPDERVRYETQTKIISDMMDQLRALEAAS